MRKERGWDETIAAARPINNSRAKLQLERAITGITQAKALPIETIDAIDQIFYRMPVNCFCCAWMMPAA